MQKIRFTYTSSRVKESVEILLFLRMNGIYVYERYFDVSERKRQEMLGTLTEVEGTVRRPEYNQFDMEMFLVGNREEYSLTEKLDMGYKTIIIGCDGFREEREYERNATPFVEYASDRGKSSENIYKILDKMLELHIIDEKECKALTMGAEVYYRAEVMKLFLKGKFFHGAESEAEYQRLRLIYESVVADLLGKLEKWGCKWGDISTIYLQYAAIYMAYESDLYCIRCNKAPNYNIESIEQICERILYDDLAAQRMGDSFGQLLAQIQDDLQRNVKKAYASYRQVCKDYNAYVYFRKALYWMDFRKNYEMAVRYLAKSLTIYPEYYRAWYRLGICYGKLGKDDEALQAFQNMEVLIVPRWETDWIRPMEIEYLFEAKYRCGFIYKKKKNWRAAIRTFLMAEKVWKAIDETQFIDFMSSGRDERSAIIRRIKKQLDVREIHGELSVLFAQKGEIAKALCYLDKYKGEK